MTKFGVFNGAQLLGVFEDAGAAHAATEVTTWIVHQLSKDFPTIREEVMFVLKRLTFGLIFIVLSTCCLIEYAQIAILQKETVDQSKIIDSLIALNIIGGTVKDPTFTIK